MSATPTMELNRRDQLLAEAISRKTRATISICDEHGWKLYHASFENSTEDRRTLWLGLLPGQDNEPNELAVGTPIGLTFRRGHKKCVCSAEVRSFVGEDGLRIAITWPRHVQELQRRVFERTEPSPSRPLYVQVQRIPRPGWPGNKAQACRGVIENISVGGIRVRFDDSPELEIGGSFLCQIDTGTHLPPLGIDAVLRHHEVPSEKGCSVGFQFIGLEAIEGGQEKMYELARLVKRLQRRGTRSRQRRSSGRGSSRGRD